MNTMSSVCTRLDELNYGYIHELQLCMNYGLFVLDIVKAQLSICA